MGQSRSKQRPRQPLDGPVKFMCEKWGDEMKTHVDFWHKYGNMPSSGTFSISKLGGVKALLLQKESRSCFKAGIYVDWNAFFKWEREAEDRDRRQKSEQQQAVLMQKEKHRDGESLGLRCCLPHVLDESLPSPAGVSEAADARCPQPKPNSDPNATREEVSERGDQEADKRGDLVPRLSQACYIITVDAMGHVGLPNVLIEHWKHEERRLKTETEAKDIELRKRRKTKTQVARQGHTREQRNGRRGGRGGRQSFNQRGAERDSCFRCGKQGHWARDCNQGQEEESVGQAR